MKKDIATPEVTDVSVAVVPRMDAGEELWDIYLINAGDQPLENVLVTSQGYGSIDGVDKTTTVLRHFHQSLPPREAIRIEPIQPSLFGINNEYWVSFNNGEHMLDKRYLFKAGTIRQEALRTLPILDRPGVIMS
ncbi:hypothetical protein CLV84_3008 [Neolewinella xylanilytica]|uniref:Uncharacterized protein n=1 Tax=Neolewinella xylanilytica TaxID=1514080 RepID=A0A2S6I4R5_9BACT|nr:hypothetical protein [Neolewinella xylanilytica]PPK86091.1 hypothetical protein CLV84_3008 [Neolewinella xylanilytica]